MSANVNWYLTSATQLTDYLSTTVAFADGGSYILSGSGTRQLNFSNLPSNIIFGGGNSIVSASFASSFSFQPSNGGNAVVSAVGLTISLDAFRNLHLVPNGAQDAIDYLFGTVVGAGSAYLGGTGNEVFQPFGNGDGLIGNTGSDLFQLGRIGTITDIAYIHGQSGNTFDPNGTDIDTIEFLANASPRTYNIHAVSNIDKLIFNDDSTTAVFYLAGITSFLPNNLVINQTGGVGSVIEVRADVDEAVNWDFSGWTLTGGVTTASLFTYDSDQDDVIVGPSGGGTIYSLIYTYGGDDSIKSGDAGDTIYAGDGNDTIDSGGFNDSVLGGAGDDLIQAGIGQDTVDGGTGDDTLFGGREDDSYDGGDDTDMLSYELLDSATLGGVVFFVQSAGAGEAVLESIPATFSNIEILRGTLRGDSFGNSSSTGMVYQGLAGGDVFSGGTGVDTVDYSDDYDFDHTTSLGVVINASESFFLGGGNGPDDINDAVLATMLAGSTVLYAMSAQGTFGQTGEDPDFEQDIDQFDDAIDRFIGSIKADFMVGGAAANEFHGNADNDWLYGEGGADSLAGDTGDDHLYGGTQNDTLDGGANNDTLDGGSGADTMLGGTGNDFYVVNSSGDVVDETSGSGTDTVQSSVSFSLAASSKVIGTFEKLTLTGTAATGTGNGSANTLTGNGSNNTLSGGSGNDTLIGGGGRDSLSGGSGVDTASYAGASKGVVIDLTDGTKNTNDAKGDVYSSIAKFIGTSHKDKFTGNSSANTFSGGSGVDTINGGGGKDTLTGGGSNDKFVFSKALGSNNVDTITDFSHDHDKIQLDDAIFKTIGSSLAGGKFYAANGAKSAHDGNDRIIYDKLTGKLYSDDDGIGGHKAVHFATLTGHPTLDAGDFSIV